MLLKCPAISTLKAEKSWIVSTLKSSSSLGVVGGMVVRYYVRTEDARRSTGAGTHLDFLNL